MYALPKNCPKHIPIIPILTQDEDTLLKGYLQDESVSCKSKSIIGLCYYLGIRAVDIVNLQLRDIDWSKDVIAFRQSKTGENVVFPLIPIIGNCIAHYITQERPGSKYLHVFLSDFAPIEPLSGHSAIYSIISNAFNKLNIRTNERQGAHLLRHNSATKQLNYGTPIGVISTLLGHSKIETTTIYLTTDYESLRLCCIEPIFKMGGRQDEIQK
jgi:integrase